MTCNRCAFLTMETTAGWSIDADLAIPPLRDLGWSVESIPWRKRDVDWNGYDAVYIGTPWDYPADVRHFLGVLETIDRSRAVLVNDIALVHWSLSKTYLRDLEEKGIAIPPSLWRDDLPAGELLSFFDRLGSDRIVVKPVISTNATDTYLLDPEQAGRAEAELQHTFAGRPFVVQAFLGRIRDEGEYSLFYFGRVFSHAIRKVPKALDFRVQEEHGASITPVLPDASLVACADRILKLIEPEPVYARCDLVRGADGRFLLMELELIEPSMYLRMHPQAPHRFAVAFDRYVASKQAL